MLRFLVHCPRDMCKSFVTRNKRFVTIFVVSPKAKIYEKNYVRVSACQHVSVSVSIQISHLSSLVLVILPAYSKFCNVTQNYTCTFLIKFSVNIRYVQESQ